MLGTHSKARAVVQQSAVLALGVLADADGDALDVHVRRVLVRVMRDGDAQAQRFTLLALGSAAGRMEEGREETPGVRVARDGLLAELTRGKRRLRPWAALGIGLLGRARLEAGRGLDESPRDACRPRAPALRRDLP